MRLDDQPARPLRFGILGAARIAEGALIAPARDLEIVSVTMIGASTPERAAQFAAVHGLPASGTYDDVLARDDVDVVYIALPPSAHAEWTLKALAAGKHVFLEKPAVTTADEARAIVAVADAAGLRLIEAFHYRYHPLFARALEVIGSGMIGVPLTAHAEFSVPIARNDSEFRWKAALGGGALADLGCYCVHWLRTIAGEEPAVSGARQWLEPDGADRRTDANLMFPSGLAASLATDMAPADGKVAASLTVTGSAGRLEIINPLSPQRGHRFTVTTPGGTREEAFSREPTFAFQLAAVAAAISTGSIVPTEGADIIGNAMVLDGIRKRASESAGLP
jgi:predicted dehydrogenase